MNSQLEEEIKEHTKDNPILEEFMTNSFIAGLKSNTNDNMFLSVIDLAREKKNVKDIFMDDDSYIEVYKYDWEEILQKVKKEFLEQ
jgi:hypothetical protein